MTVLAVAQPAAADVTKPAPQAGVLASCSSTGCNGLDPQAAGCSSGATTLESVRSKNSIFIELRYSSACNAAWTRYDNIYGDAGTIYIRGSSHTYSKQAAGYAGETGWTKMVSFTELVRSCVVFWDPSWGQYLESCTPER
jgi:hypothetical protein